MAVIKFFSTSKLHMISTFNVFYFKLKHKSFLLAGGTSEIISNLGMHEIALTCQILSNAHLLLTVMCVYDRKGYIYCSFLIGKLV